VRWALRAGGALLTGAVAVVLLPGCGEGEKPARPGAEPARASARPALCARLRARVTGEVATTGASELSGLAISRSQAGVLWTHNDSGDVPRVFAVTSRGRVLAELAVPGAEARDWEDIAVGPGSGGRPALYLADIGDNAMERPSVTVYRVREPRVPAAAGGSTARAGALALRYPDGAHDAEALLVSPTSGALFIVTKAYGGRAGVYLAARPRLGSTTTLRRVGSVSLGSGDAVTAGDVSADGGTIALRSYLRALVWPRRRGESIAAALKRRPCVARADLIDEGQGESLALTRDGGAFYTVPEGERPDIRRYSPASR
jgi:hypothetical protein